MFSYVLAVGGLVLRLVLVTLVSVVRVGFGVGFRGRFLRCVEVVMVLG